MKTHNNAKGLKTTPLDYEVPVEKSEKSMTSLSVRKKNKSSDNEYEYMDVSTFALL